MSDDQITVTKTVDAGPEQLFAVLSTPSRHRDIDGSGMLRGTDTSSVSGVGDEFVMRMNNDLLGDYEIKNRVTAYEQNRKIGWAPSLHPMDAHTDKLGDARVTGHTYTWFLEPAGDGRTTVTQVYDWSGVTDPSFRGFLPLLNEQMLGDSIDKAARAAS
ncbi:MAG: SRPBCC family protein [Actinomycetota bacterium]|nr:SRPBCC family protein [Actinomycetota bacterium]